MEHPEHSFRLMASVFDHDVIGKKHDRFYAWCWMVSQARWIPGHVHVGGHKYEVKRGQFRCSTREMARRCKMGIGQINRFLAALRRGGLDGQPLIKTDNSSGKLIITICNFDRYQDHPQVTHQGQPA